MTMRITAKTIRKLSSTGELPDMLGNDFLDHVAERHLDICEENCLAAVLLGSTESGFDGKFTDTTAMRSLVCNTAYACAEDIAAYADEIARSGGKLPPKRRFDANVHPRFSSNDGTARQSIFGRNPLTGAVFEVFADNGVLVLAPDPASEDGLPFKGVTAYARPDQAAILGAARYRTGRDMLPLMRACPVYASASLLHRAYLEKCCDANHDVRSQFGASDDVLRISLPDEASPMPSRKLQLVMQGSARVGIECSLLATDYGPGDVSSRLVPAPPFQDGWDRLLALAPHEMGFAESVIDAYDELKRGSYAAKLSIAEPLTIDDVLAADDRTREDDREPGI